MYEKDLSKDWNTEQNTEGTLGRVIETEQLSDKTNRKIACRSNICTINTLEHDTKLCYDKAINDCEDQCVQEVIGI
jgi:hypothetical protein